MLINHANYSPGWLTQVSSDPDCLPPSCWVLGFLCSACPSVRLRPWWRQRHFPENKCCPQIIINYKWHGELLIWIVIQITGLSFSAHASFLFHFTVSFLKDRHYYYSCFTDEWSCSPERLGNFTRIAQLTSGGNAINIVVWSDPNINKYMLIFNINGIEWALTLCLSCSKHFPCIDSLNLCNSMERQILLFPFC